MNWRKWCVHRKSKGGKSVSGKSVVLADIATKFKAE